MSTSPFTQEYAAVNLEAINRSTLDEVPEGAEVFGKIGDDQWRIWAVRTAKLDAWKEARTRLSDARERHQAYFTANRAAKHGGEVCKALVAATEAVQSAEETCDLVTTELIASIEEMHPTLKVVDLMVCRDGSLIKTPEEEKPASGSAMPFPFGFMIIDTSSVISDDGKPNYDAGMRES